MGRALPKQPMPGASGGMQGSHLRHRSAAASALRLKASRPCCTKLCAGRAASRRPCTRQKSIKRHNKLAHQEGKATLGPCQGNRADCQPLMASTGLLRMSLACTLHLMRQAGSAQGGSQAREVTTECQHAQLPIGLDSRAVSQCLRMQRNLL